MGIERGVEFLLLVHGLGLLQVGVEGMLGRGSVISLMEKVVYQD